MFKKLQQKIIISMVLSCLLVLTGCVSQEVTQEYEPFEFSEGVSVAFATVEKAHELLSIEDEYLNGFTAFDKEAKISGDKKTVEAYVEGAKTSVGAWTEEEVEKIKSNLKYIQKQMAPLDLNVKYPETIYLIKSSCEEEGNASGYTRQNFIVLNKNRITNDLIVHELFHIISRYNYEKSKEIYQTIGFEKVDKIDFPQVLMDRIITNPDATDLNYVIEVEHKNQIKKGALVMYAEKDYTGGSFFKYITLGLYFPETASNFTFEKMVSLAEVDGFFEKIGTNTDYIIHPEEITAEHFRLLVLKKYEKYPNAELVKKVHEILSQ